MGRGGTSTVARAQKTRRTNFLFIYSYFVQFVFMWILSRDDGLHAAATVAKVARGG